MNIRGVLPIGVGDDLIGQADDGTVVFVEPSSGPDSSMPPTWASVTSSPRMSETFSSSLRPDPPSLPSCRRTQELGDIPSEADGKANIQAGERPFDIRHSIEIPGIVRQNFDGRSIPFERHPVVLLQVVDIQVFQQFDVDECSFAVFDVGTLVKLRDRLADVQFRNLVLLDQDAFEVGRNTFPGFGDGIVEFILRNFAVRHQQVELGRRFFRRDFAEIEERDSQRFCDFCNGFFVLSRKAEPALLVEELEDTHQVFVVRHDRIGQDLFGLESRAFVVGGVVDEGGMDRLAVLRCCRHRQCSLGGDIWRRTLPSFAR